MNFKEKVFKATKKIPKGKIATYKIIARKAGNSKAFRAVGNALNTNMSKAVPCHRVIKSDGSLGGYRQGVDRKKNRLIKEGIEIKNNKINLEKFLFV